jgi:hypothetical protein
MKRRRNNVAFAMISIVPIPFNFYEVEIGAVPIPINRGKAEIGAVLITVQKKKKIRAVPTTICVKKLKLG